VTVTTVLVLNGPNLQMLGVRQPEIYGSVTLADIAAACRDLGAQLGLAVDLRQTDDEGELIGWVHEAFERQLPVIINPAAFTHYSYALRDAMAMLTSPVIEIHLSNPAARESFRHTSVVSAVATGTIAGFGPQSYELALRAVAKLLAAAGPNH
jgi:3-dehydroquinate dehydratase II